MDMLPRKAIKVNDLVIFVCRRWWPASKLIVQAEAVFMNIQQYGQFILPTLYAAVVNSSPTNQYSKTITDLRIEAKSIGNRKLALIQAQGTGGDNWYFSTSVGWRWKFNRIAFRMSAYYWPNADKSFLQDSHRKAPQPINRTHEGMLRRLCVPLPTNWW